jgi:hypothetical protein
LTPGERSAVRVLIDRRVRALTQDERGVNRPEPRPQVRASKLRAERFELVRVSPATRAYMREAQ